MSDSYENNGNGLNVGTATSRAMAVRKAVRRRAFARLALSAPSGAGKTWTGLGIATDLAEGRQIVVIDTEFESAELYADTYTFSALPWDPPYDPRDLAATITELSRGSARDGVIMVDSASHFWRGSGGTLDIADGRFGGWKTATPAQDDLVMAILAAPCHVIICTRAKQSYEVSESTNKDGNKKQSVTKLGLAPIQRDDFEYEMNVVAMLDMEHRIDIGKTRCHPLAGKSFAANHQHELAAIYGEWLKGGEPPARQTDIDDLVALVKGITDDHDRQRIAKEFFEKFGKPTDLTESAYPEAAAWLAANVPEGTVAATEAPAPTDGQPAQQQRLTSKPEPSDAHETAQTNLEFALQALPEPAQGNCRREIKATFSEPQQMELDEFRAALKMVEDWPVGTPPVEVAAADATTAPKRTAKQRGLIAYARGHGIEERQLVALASFLADTREPRPLDELDDEACKSVTSLVDDVTAGKVKFETDTRGLVAKEVQPA